MWYSKLVTLSLLPTLLVASSSEEMIGSATAPTPQTGCFLRPWVCRDRPFFLLPRLCCRDVCVDVRSDENNCGFCRVQCPPSWGCCNAGCFNLNVNMFHCGRCFNVCPAGQVCRGGACIQLASAVAATVD